MNTKLVDPPTEYDIERREWWYIDQTHPLFMWGYAIKHWHEWVAIPKTKPQVKYFRNEDL